MPPGRRLRTRLIAAVVLLLAHSLAGAAVTGGPAFDSNRPRWTQLEFRAAKFLLSASASVDARIRPSAEIAGRLVATPTGRPVPAGPEVLEMIYRASGLGRDSVTTLWADPLGGGTLQRTQLDTGGRQRQRTYRFTDVGAYHYTRWPAGSAEEDLPPERWTERTEGARPYSPSAVGKPVTEATVLLWLVAAADLANTGDAMEVLTFSRRHVNRVRVEVAGRRSIAVDFSERDASGTRQRRGKTEAIVMRLGGSPLDPEPGDVEAFELLGLHGDLELLLDPRTRAPLELRGDVKIAGKITVRLRRAILR